MSGIYVHIPFCKKRCTYCSFYSTTLLSNIDKYIDAVCREAVSKSFFLDDSNVTTLYFGGGTPSLLDHTHINRLYDTLTKVFKMN